MLSNTPDRMIDECTGIGDMPATDDPLADTRVLLDDEDRVERDNLHSPLLYRYMTWTFQYVEKRPSARTLKKVIIFRILQVSLLLIACAYAMYQCHQYWLILDFEIKYSETSQ